MNDSVLSITRGPWLNAMMAVAKHYRLECSEENVRVSMAWEHGAPLEALLERMAREMGLAIRFDRFSERMLDPWRLPLVAEFSNGQVGVIEKADGQGQVSVCFGDDQGLATMLTVADVADRVVRVVLLRPLSSVPDARVDEYIKPYQPDWFWQIALRDWRRYADVMLASLVTNVLALAGMIFSMQVYDRVVPAQSEPTLWVLFGGVLLAITFEFVLRMSRVHLSDLIGKRADLRISDRVFGRALRIRNDARPKSTGTFISQIRELEQVRELMTSTTIGAVADLPFFLLFLCVMWLVAGPLAWIPLAAVPLLVIPGLLVQKPLARLSSEGMRESSIRNAMLVEAVQGIEDIKLLRAEPRFQGQWNHLNEVSADLSMKQRYLTGLLLSWTQELQSIVYAVVLLVGCFMVMKGDLTTGALVGASILASRMMAPLAQVSGVFARWQQAKVARKGIDALMERPVDQPERSRLLHRPVIRGAYTLQDVRFLYTKDDRQPALDIKRLVIQPGEKIAVLGRNGAGKSTLLQLLAGMQSPQAGQVLLDGLHLPLIDPADVRRDMGLLNQNASLFHGTLRENLTLGAPQATDEEMLEALTLSGALAFVQNRPDGLDHVILEGGVGLSGGQRQSLLLARTLIRQPHIVLLDEPTAWLDEMTEKQVIERLQGWLKGRTLVVATHRLAVLQCVDRVIVLDGGRVVMDDSRDKILAKQAVAA